MTTEPTPTSAMTDVYPSPSETNHFSLAGLPQSRRASGTAGAVLSKSPPMKTPMTLQFGTDTQFLPSQEPAPKPPSSVRSTSTASSSGSGSSSSWSPPDVHQMRQDLTVKSVLNPFDYGIEVEMDGETHCQADANVDARMDGIDSPLASPFAAPGAGVGFGVSLDLDSLDYNPPHSPALPPLPLSPSGGFGFSHMHLFDAPSADPFSSLPPAAKVPPPAPRSSSSGGSDPVSNYQGSSTYSRSVASAGTELSDLYGGGEPLSGDAYGSDPYGAVAPHEDVKPALNNISPSDMSVAATAADKLDLDFDLDLDRGSGSGSGPRSLYHQAQLSYIPEMNPRSVDTVSAATTVNNAIPIAAATPSPLHPVPVPRGAPPPTLFHPAAPDSSSSHRLAHLIGEQYLPSAGGVCYVYSDGSAVPKTVNGEPVNASWGVTKAGKPRRRLAQACVACRDRKIKCEPDVPKCTQCRKGGKVCRYENAPRGNGPAKAAAATATVNASVSAAGAASGKDAHNVASPAAAGGGSGSGSGSGSRSGSKSGSGPLRSRSGTGTGTGPGFGQRQGRKGSFGSGFNMKVRIKGDADEVHGDAMVATKSAKRRKSDTAYVMGRAI